MDSHLQAHHRPHTTPPDGQPGRYAPAQSQVSQSQRSLVHAALFVLLPRATAARVVGADLGCSRGLLAGLALDERLEGLVLMEREAVVGGVGGEHLWCQGTRHVRHAPRLLRVRRTYSRPPPGQATLSLRCVQHAGGWYAEPARQVTAPRGVRVNTGEDLLADILHLAAQVDVVAALAHVVIRALRRVRRRVG